MEFRKTLSSIILAVLLLSEVQVGLIPDFQPIIQELQAAGSPLGSASYTPNSFDHDHDENGNGVSRPSGGTLNCPSGQVVTSVAYLGSASGNDGTDGLTIACSPINADGTLGTQNGYLSNGDIDSNPRRGTDLVQPTCNGNNAVATLYWADLGINHPDRADSMDGEGIGCRQISCNGFGTDEVELDQPGDFLPHGSQQATPIESMSCPDGQVLVGIVYDSFGSQLSADTDAMDAVTKLRCAPVNNNFCPPPPTDLAVTKSVDHSTAIVGDNVTFTIHLSNNGPSAVSTVTVSDLLPAGLSFVSANATTGSYNQNSGAWTITQVFTAGASADLTIVAHTNQAGTLTNTATITHSSLPDPNGSNDSASASVTVQQPQADLSIQKTGPATIQRNAGITTIQYQINVTNAGPGVSGNITVTDPIPSGLTFNPSQSPSYPTCHQVGANVVCDNFALNPGASANPPFTIAFDVPALNGACSQSIVTNTASVTSVTPDSTQGNNQSTAQTTVTCPPPQFTGTKIADVTSIQPGGTIVYTLTATNNGPTSQANIRLADTIPAGLTFVPSGMPGSQSTPGCAIQSANIYCASQTVNPSQTIQVKLQFQLSPNASCGGTTSLVNTGFIDQSSVSLTTTNTLVVGVTCPQNADLSITKTVDHPTAIVGDNVTFTVHLTNAGPTTVNNITVSDLLPAGLSFVSATPMIGSYNQNSGAWTITQALALNASADLYIVARVNQVGTFTNTATMTSSNITDPVSGNNSASASVTVQQPQSDLSVIKTGPTSIVRGQIATFTVTASNAGPDTATNVVITDPIPTGLTFNAAQSSPGCVLNGAQTAVLCNSFSLISGNNHSVQIAFNVPTIQNCSQTSFQNTASVSSSSTDPNSGNNQVAALPTSVTCPVVNADVSIQKTGPSSITRGGSISYLLTVTNNGPATATNVVIHDDISNLIPPPNGFTLTSSNGAGCQLVNNGNEVTCALGSLTVGQPLTVTLVFSVPSVQNCSQTTATNIASVTSDTDANAVNNQSQVVTTVTCPVINTSDLSITKIGPQTALRGTSLTYALTASNNGPSVATGTTIVDAIPSGLTFVNFTAPSGVTCGLAQGNTVVQCSLGTLAVGPSAVINLHFTSTLGQTCSQSTVTNTAMIQSTVTDPISGNNSSQFQTILTCPAAASADLSIVKAGPVQLQKGNVITYTFIASNIGPDSAVNVVIHDIIPAGLSYLSSSGAPCTVVSGELLCTVASIPSGQSTGIISATFQTAAAGNNCTQSTLTNTATITSDTTDPSAANNSSQLQTTLTCPVQQNPNLYITKDGPATVNAGGTITYNFTLRNTSNFTAQDVDVYDYFINANYNQITSPFTFLSSTGLTCALDVPSGKVECEAGDMTANQLITFTMTFQTPANAPQLCNQVIVNKGEAISNYNQATVDTDTAPTTVLCPTGQFTVTKIGPVNLSPNELQNYLITITNTTQTTQNGVRLADVIPAGLTFVPAGSTAGCAVQTGTVYCPTQSFTAGQAVSYTLQFQANQNIACNSQVVNTALVQQYGNQVAQSAPWTSDVQCTIPKLDITKSAPPTVNLGGTITYNYVLRNTSQTQAATEIELYDFNINAQADPIDPLFTFVSISTGTCDPLDSFGRMHCYLPDLTPNQIINFTMTFSVPNNQALCSQTVINQVDVWTQHDIDNADWDKAQTVVQCAQPNADLSIVKTGSSSVVRGGIAYYQMTATNAGPDTATNVVISDPIPAGLTFNPSQSTAGCALNGAQTIVLCNSFSLTNGASRTVHIAFNVPTISNCTQTSIQNTAAVSSSITDPVSTNNQSNAVTTTLTCPIVINTADLSIQKSGPSSIVRGNDLSYSLSVTNAGPSLTPANIVVTDPIPQGQNLTFNQGSSTAGCSQSGTSIVCLSTVGPNSSSNFTLSFNVPTVANCTGAVVQNTATVTSQLTDLVPSNNTSQTVSTTLLCPVTATSDVSVTKTGPSNVVRGSNAVYTLTAQNAGPGVATNVVIADHIPAGLSFSAAQSSSGCVLNGGQTAVLCNNFSLQSGESRSFQVSFAVPTIANCTQSTITNSASVSVSSTDPNPANNQSQVTTTLLCPTITIADLRVNLTGPATADRGSNVVYTALVTNSGSTAQAATVQIPLPNGLNYVSASGANCTVAGATLTCALGNMTNGQSIAVVLTYAVPTITPCNGPVSTQVNAFVASQTSDSNNANNTSQVTTTLNCTGTTGGLSVYKTDNRTTANAGDRLNYTIIITNSASTAANNLTVTDTLPYGLTILTVSDGATINGQNVTWNNITVNANASRTLTVSVQVRSDVSNNTVLRNTANVNGQSSTDETTISSGTYQPPYYPPVLPPYTPPAPPVFYPPAIIPPTYYPPVILPETGSRDAHFYSSTNDTENLTDANRAADADAQNPLVVFYITLITLLAAGSAAAGKFLTGAF